MPLTIDHFSTVVLVALETCKFDFYLSNQANDIIIFIKFSVTLLIYLSKISNISQLAVLEARVNESKHNNSSNIIQKPQYTSGNIKQRMYEAVAQLKIEFTFLFGFIRFVVSRLAFSKLKPTI